MKVIYICFLLLLYSINSVSQEKESSIREIDYALIEASRLKVMGNIDEAVKLYKTCVASYPECAAAWYELGSIYTSSGLINEAEDFIKKAYTLNKQNYWYVMAYADILNKNNKYKEAVNVLNKAIKDFKKEELLIKFNIADNYNNLQKFNKAINALNDLEKKYGISELISAKKIEIYKKQEEDKKVEQEFEKIMNTDPYNISFLILYAEYLVEKEHINEAIQKYEFVLSLDEENIYAISNLTELYEKSGDFEKSYNFLLKTFQSDHISINKKIQTLS